ncbi:MAG: hypothetical protein O4804_18710 [Trichodesmium sp. St11_bin5]|nr:hypothetical protein [Trichodesmium sp. MAG_R01]MDE5096159.1 hypothetical protein [Trichodesmium sp. St11_bin5]
MNLEDDDYRADGFSDYGWVNNDFDSGSFSGHFLILQGQVMKPMSI